MKKIILSLFIVILTIIVFPFEDVLAKDITSLNVDSDNDRINVNGTTEDGVLAIAVLVYSEDSLIHMETCSSGGSEYVCELNKSFETGDYIVKVADYDGGDYISKDVKVINDEPVDEKNPQTYDRGILKYIGIFVISLLGIVFSIVKIKKKV